MLVSQVIPASNLIENLPPALTLRNMLPPTMIFTAVICILAVLPSGDATENVCSPVCFSPVSESRGCEQGLRLKWFDTLVLVCYRHVTYNVLNKRTNSVSSLVPQKMIFKHSIIWCVQWPRYSRWLCFDRCRILRTVVSFGGNLLLFQMW